MIADENLWEAQKSIRELNREIGGVSTLCQGVHFLTDLYTVVYQTIVVTLRAVYCANPTIHRLLQSSKDFVIVEKLCPVQAVSAGND
jgi:hypothetical protein